MRFCHCVMNAPQSTSHDARRLNDVDLRAAMSLPTHNFWQHDNKTLVPVKARLSAVKFWIN